MIQPNEKKPLPKITDINRDAFLYVLMSTIEQLTRKRVYIGIKQEALDAFPDCDKPVFAWNNSKEQWFISMPTSEKKPKIVTLDKRIIR